MSQAMTKILSLGRWPMSVYSKSILLVILLAGLSGCGVTTGVPDTGGTTPPGGGGGTGPTGPAPTLIAISPQSGSN